MYLVLVLVYYTSRERKGEGDTKFANELKRIAFES